MRAMIVTRTGVAGNQNRIRFNPMALVCWGGESDAEHGWIEIVSEHEANWTEDPITVLETPAQIDWLFARATGEPMHEESMFDPVSVDDACGQVRWATAVVEAAPDLNFKCATCHDGCKVCGEPPNYECPACGELTAPF